MRLQQTPTRLTLRILPWIPWVVAGALVLAAVLPSLLVEKTRLACDRAVPPGSCTLAKTALLRRTVETFALDTVSGVTLNRVSSVSRNTNNTNTVYQVQLDTTAGPLLLTDSYSSDGGQAQRQVSQIEAFLQDSSQSQVVIEEDGTWTAMLFLLFFGAGAVGVLLTLGTPVTLVMDKLSHRLILTRYRLAQKEQIDHSLRHVVGLRIQASPSLDQEKSATYTLVVALTNGESLPLTPYATPELSSKQRICEQVATFLGQPIPADPKQWVDRVNPAQIFMASNPGDMLSLVLKGKAAREGAIADCRARLEQDPRSLDSHARLVMILTMDGQKPAAEAHLIQARQQLLAAGDKAQADHLSALLEQLRGGSFGQG